jgi:spermidine/putrescine transport system ATP-binding protein
MTFRTQSYAIHETHSKTPYVLEVENVSKCFRESIILDSINFTVRAGEFLSVVGHSGCGKSTLLSLISGLAAPDSGNILIDGQDVRGLSPQQRHVNTVFQNYALFPHLTVFENIAFSLRCKRLPNQTVQSRTKEALQMVQLSHLAARKPQQLSGGQQQRVAIARAVINQPRILLLDEPLSSLDYRMRKTMQLELKQLQNKLGIAFIFVTHDQEEALSIADRVVVMDAGRIEQIGTPREVYEEPCNLKVAQFIGEANILPTKVLEINESIIKLYIEEKIFTLENRRNFKANQPLCALIRPEDLQIWAHSEVKDPKQMFPGIVEQVIYKGSTVDLMVRLASQKLLAATQFFNEDDEELDFQPGEPVWVSWIPGWEVILPYE